MQLTRAMLAQSRVIARGRGIREVDRLVLTYGGRVSGWIEKSSPIVLVRGQRAEIH